MSRKKRILFNSNYSRMLTGFGKNTKNVLTYLQKTGKYELLEYASQMVDGHPDLQTLPWAARGALPNNQYLLNELNRDQHKARLAAYGEYNADSVLKDFKPDVSFWVEDRWGSSEWVKNKSFSKHIPCVYWVTQDSKPLIGPEDADSTPYYWTWADFARKEFHKIGKNHVKTQYPPVDLSNFYNIGYGKIKELRNKFKIPDDVFVIGDSSRNQLRKFTNLIEGYAQFRKENPSTKSILLLITNFSEGWDIPRLAKTYGVDMREIWTAYISSECNEYFLHPFIGQDQKCPFTGKEKAVSTVNIHKGLTEEQLNEAYNIMDVFLHSTTSGGCELTVVEAASAEKIIIVPDYSYGEDIIELNRGALCLDWAKYLEFGTQFEKSAPFPSSIAKQLKKVCEMSSQKRLEMGKHSREWAKENYDLELNCKKIEEFIDSLPFIDWSGINLKAAKSNPNYTLPSNYKDLTDEQFVNLLYKEILLREPDQNGFNNWMQQLKSNAPREKIYDFFIDVAKKDAPVNNQQDIWSIVDKDRANKRLLFSLKQSAGDIFISTSLLKSLKEQYPDTDIYFMCEEKYHEIIYGNTYIHKILPWIEQLDHEMIATSCGQKEKLFDIYINPSIATQTKLNYLSNNNINLNLSY